MNIVENNDLDNNILCHEVLTIAKSVLSERELDILIDYTSRYFLVFLFPFFSDE
jgi:hypothetical protein